MRRKSAVGAGLTSRRLVRSAGLQLRLLRLRLPTHLCSDQAVSSPPGLGSHRMRRAWATKRGRRNNQAGRWLFPPNSGPWFNCGHANDAQDCGSPILDGGPASAQAREDRDSSARQKSHAAEVIHDITLRRSIAPCLYPLQPASGYAGDAPLPTFYQFQSPSCIRMENGLAPVTLPA